MKTYTFQCLFFVCCLYSMCLCAQARKDSIFISQYITDSFTRRGIPDVFVTLADSNGILIDTLRTKNESGTKNYEWRKKVARREQTFLVKVEHPDYETVTQRLELHAMPRSIDGYGFPELFIKREFRETTMQEMSVTATRVQLTYKGDTIVVDARAFKIPEGSMLDALVARVPGAELKSDGTIYMNGRKVDYLTLNGKDFFRGRNRIMLDNLPYYVVSKLMFYEKKVPLSQMVHRATGENDYVMDVELKREYSTGYMANVEAGVGTNERWMARLFGMRFTDNSRLVLFGGANNTNETRSPDGDGWNEDLKTLTGEKESKMMGGSFNVDDKHRRYCDNVEATVRWTDNWNETRFSRETFLSDGSAFSRIQDASRDKDFSASLRNNFKLKKRGFDFNTALDYANGDGNGLSHAATFLSDPSAYGSCVQILDSLFAPSVTAGLREININRVIDRTSFASNSYNLGQDIAWDKGFRHGNNLSVKLGANYGKDKRNGFSRYDLTYTDPDLAENKQDRFTPYRHHNYSYNADIDYRKFFPHGWFIDCTYSYKQQYDNTDNPLYRLDGLGTSLGFGILPSQAEYLQTIDAGNSFQSHYMTKTHRTFLAIKRTYSDEEERLFIYGIGSYILRKDESVHHWRMHDWHDKQRGYWLAEPMAYFDYRYQGTKREYHRFKVEYNCQSTTPNLVQMLNIQDTSNPLALTQGNPNLKASRRHSIDMLTGRGRFGAGLWLSMNANIFENLVANGFTYNSTNGVYTYRPENVKGNWNGTVSMNGNRYLDSKKQTMIKGRTAYNYIRNVDLTRVEGFSASQLNRVKHHIISQNLNLSYNRENLRLELAGNFAWNTARRELDKNNDISAFDFNYGLSGQYTFPWKIQLATDLKMYSRRGYEESSMNRDELVWNASVSRPFLKERLIVKVDAFDILNQLSNTRYIVNGQGRTEIWQLCMPRYAMLRVAYRFNKNPKKE